MSRPRSNCSVIAVVPSALLDVISVIPAIRANWRSSGVATVAAMISALAPGSAADTLIVGKSIWGSGDTGSTANATAPAITSAADSRIVATGRRMNGADRFISALGAAPGDGGRAAGATPPRTRGR